MLTTFERALGQITGLLLAFLGVADPSGTLSSAGQSVAVSVGGLLVAVTHFWAAWQSVHNKGNGTSNNVGGANTGTGTTVK